MAVFVQRLARASTAVSACQISPVPTVPQVKRTLAAHWIRVETTVRVNKTGSTERSLVFAYVMKVFQKMLHLLINGTANNGITDFWLIMFSIKANYSGNQCEVIVDPSSCFNNPCQNGGICTPVDSYSYYCLCTSAFAGMNCQYGKSNYRLN
jgi:hypothetical protein